MPGVIWQAALGAVVTLSGMLGAFLARRTRSERNVESAVKLTVAYGEFVDDLRQDVQDSRKHIHRQDGEMAALRVELSHVKATRDQELGSLRGELAAVRQELAAARTENQQLRTRVAQLERRDLAA
jgi:chromosome segregation ATPase